MDVQSRHLCYQIAFLSPIVIDPSSHTFTYTQQLPCPSSSSSSTTTKLLSPAAIAAYLHSVRSFLQSRKAKVVSLDLKGSLVEDAAVEAVSFMNGC